MKKYDNIILKTFNVVSSFKKNIPNTYNYSNKYPPPRKNYKYTDKLFIACILYITLNNCSWTSFIGPITGKQVHKRFMEYSKNNLFKKLFLNSIKNYTLIDFKNKSKLISVDSSTIFNKNNKDLTIKNPYYKNKKCAKITALVDSIGSPLSITLDNSNKHDCKLFDEVFDKGINNKNIKRRICKNAIILADKGYDSNKIRNKIKKNKLKCIIAHNKRNCKSKNKIKSLNKSEKKIYKKRVKVEHFFGIIKKYPKINNVYEKTIASYLNLVLFVSSMLLIKRTPT